MAAQPNAQINISFQKEMAENLHVRSTSQSIDSLLSSRRKEVDYQAPYQRNYVWNEEKATFFIESILLGVEIPPLIFFVHANNKKKLEVIDGRQRYQTIKKFKEGEFSLRKNGLSRLKNLAGKKYQDLIDSKEKDLENAQYRRAFNNTTLRIIEFSSKNPNSDQNQQTKLEDTICKEIFRRYNTGITPLKKIEVKNARHEGDNFTDLMKRTIRENRNGWVAQFDDLFLKVTPKDHSPDKTMNKLRDLIVLEYFPINVYASTSVRSEVSDRLFSEYIEGDSSQGIVSLDQEQSLQRLINKVELLQQLKVQLDGQSEWLIYQVVFWALSIVEKEEIDIKLLFVSDFIAELSEKITANIDLFTGTSKGFSSTTNERFKLIADFFADKTDIKFSDYLRNQKPKGAETAANFKEQRLARQEAETTTVENLILKMIDNEYQIRPPYQRQEVINNKKASGIIESILLGIPLPTIFIYRRNDGVCEVVDGQQRLLSILGYIGEAKHTLVAEGKSAQTDMRSKKDHSFKLANKLNIRSDIEGKSFADLDDLDQDKIWDFELSIVYINQDTNPDFDPIDLFIRLNDKSYDIKDPSFEMWNSYAAPEIMQEIKDIAKDYQAWFYYMKNDKRMRLEELLLTLTYIDAKAEASIFQPLQIYSAKGNQITFRVENAKIDHWLDDIGHNQNAQQHALNSIEHLKDFINKVSYLLGASLPPEQKADKFNELVDLKTMARNQRGFYILWLLLAQLSSDTLKNQKEAIFQAIKQFITDNKTRELASQDDVVKDEYQSLVENFWVLWEG